MSTTRRQDGAIGRQHMYIVDGALDYAVKLMFQIRIVS